MKQATSHTLVNIVVILLVVVLLLVLTSAGGLFGSVLEEIHGDEVRK
jgi:hypothetical protein